VRQISGLHHVAGDCAYTYCISARQQAACVRLQLLGITSYWSTTLATFSPLPLEITKVRRQVQSVLEELQVSNVAVLRSARTCCADILKYCTAPARAV
jgi:hypothetical protein